MSARPVIVLVLAAVGVLVLVVLVLGLRGDDGGAPNGQGDIDLGAIPTATYPPELPEVVFVNDLLTRTPQATPTRTGEEEIYIVQPGDNPSLIAQKYDITYQELLDYNNLDVSVPLMPGQELKIPPRETTPGPDETGTPGPDETATPEPDATETPSNGETIDYTVVPGDTASTIAERFGVTLEELAAANNTTVDELRFLNVGQVLKIPRQ